MRMKGKEMKMVAQLVERSLTPPEVNSSNPSAAALNYFRPSVI